MSKNPAFRESEEDSFKKDPRVESEEDVQGHVKTPSPVRAKGPAVADEDADDVEGHIAPPSALPKGQALPH